MTTVHYEAHTHRLRISGSCPAEDRVAVRDALETFAGLAGGHLIVDMTAVTVLDQAVANDVIAATREVAERGVSCRILRKAGEVDDALNQAERASPDTNE